jgi:hypothetical protein
VLSSNTLVSCGMMGFPAEVLPQFQRLFEDFLRGHEERLQSAEFFFPSAVSQLIAEGTAVMKVLPTNSRWYGFTYRQDREMLIQTLAAFVRAGEYPGKLFS